METNNREVLYLPTGEGKSLQIMSSQVEIKAASENTEDAFAVLEYCMAPQTPGPPPHLHRRTDEAFYVLEGELTFHLDDRSIKAESGAFVLVPHGVVHTFENAASSEVRFLEIVTPGAFAGYFGELVAALPAGGGPPDPATVTALYEKYDIVPAGAQEEPQS